MNDKQGIVRRAEYSLANPEPTPEPPDPFSQLRDELATLEEEATRLLSGQRENAMVELSPIRRVFRYVTRLRSDGWDLQRQLSEANERIGLFQARLKQLEGIVQSAFARAVKGLSANAPAAQAGADKVVKLVEEHIGASRFLDEQEVPGATLLARVKWLHDRATKTTVVDGSGLFDETTIARAQTASGAVIDVESTDGEWRCDCPRDPKFDTSINPAFVKACGKCGKSRPGEIQEPRPGHWGPVGDEPLRCNWVSGFGNRCTLDHPHDGQPHRVT